MGDVIGLLLLVATVELGGVFGAATASVDSISDSSMILELEVEVSGSAEAVVAHLAFEDEPALTLPLLDRGDGVFGIRTELEPKNYAVAFELIGENAATSEPVLLTDLGADLSQALGGLQRVSEDEDFGLSGETRRLGWLALGLGAASLSALAFWVLGGRDRPKGDALPEEE